MGGKQKSQNGIDRKKIEKNFNDEIDDVLVRDSIKGTLHGRVCLVCDKLMKKKETHLMGLKSFAKYAPLFKCSDPSMPRSLVQQYKFESLHELAREVASEENRDCLHQLENCLLSPRSKLAHSNANTLRSPKVMLCKECKGGLNTRKLNSNTSPRFAIANGMAIGTAPPCLQELNEIELALISQARFRGHLFTYWGGCHKSIKGWHSFYDVDVGHTTAVLGAVQKLTDSDNMAVVLCGPFTPLQRERALKKTTIDGGKVLRAFKWLQENNSLCKDLPQPSIGKPMVIDTSSTAESKNSDIETKEEITVVFPNGTATTGGCTDGAEFETVLAELRSQVPNVEPVLMSRPSSNALRDFRDKNLLRAFPLQFPCGNGSHEDLDVTCSQNGYLKHLLSLSIPAFHESCFVLTAHNMFERSRVLMGSMWRVTGSEETCNVTEKELNDAIIKDKRGLQASKSPGKTFLQSLRTVKRNLGHTNEAAAAAQAKFLSLTHHFGCPKVLFTVSFDDSLDIRILTLSGKEDVQKWVENLTHMPPEEAGHDINGLNELRLRYPGLCAYNFECLIDVVLDKLVGDNDTKEGVFGKLEAYGMAVEEQNRKTLHAHIVVYISDWNETLRDFHSSRKRTQKSAEKKVTAFVDEVMSTELCADEHPFKCDACGQNSLAFQSGYDLRTLRHKHGCVKEGGILARCESCKRLFTADDIAAMRAGLGVDWRETEEHDKSRIAAQILNSTVPGERLDTCRSKRNYRHNHHKASHTRTCFKKGLECRARLPDIPEDSTNVIYSQEMYDQCEWTGEAHKLNNLTVRIKRNPKDAYTNTYCQAITNCKAPANSNVSVTTGCRSSIYCTCYATKGTQKEDTQELKKVSCYVCKRFSEQRKESSLLEGLSRLMGAVIVGTSEHVASSPMAAYLVRNQSRFRCSHEFQCVPIREMIDILTKKVTKDKMDMTVVGDEEGCFLSNQAMHYLRRPKDLEDKSMKKFFEEHEIKKTKFMNDEDDNYNIDDRKHPGFGKQFVKKRDEPVLSQFSHWAFPDAASFGGCIWDFTEQNINSTVENYCRAVLVLFVPFRSIDDLTIDGSYFKKFKRLYCGKTIPKKDRMRETLNNVQMFYNSVRMPGLEDPLCDLAKAYECENNSCDCQEKEDEEDDDDLFYDGFFAGANPADVSPANTPPQDDALKEMTLTSLRKIGYRNCGFSNLASPDLLSSLNDMTQNDVESESKPFISIEGKTEKRGEKRGHDDPPPRDKPTAEKLMKLVYTNKRRIVAGEEKAASSVVANGSVESIIRWSRQKDLNMDREQRLAFQIVTSTFVLTYYDEATTESSTNRSQRSQVRRDFMSEKVKLRQLARRKKENPLRMFLDGAGGSGKSHVVNEVLLYAKEFTTNLEFKFDTRTIVVTALSGVAAVSIGGETIHSAAFLNGKVPNDDQSWVNARLLIIDEVSFMSSEEVDKLDTKLKQLKRNYGKVFGGMNVLFCGDFRQLDPVKGNALCHQNDKDIKWSSSMNCYLELKGLFRFKDDPQWGKILGRMREDKITTNDIMEINKRVLNRVNVRLPSNASYCVYMNNDRSAVNTGVFHKVLKQSEANPELMKNNVLVVKGSNICRRSKGKKERPMAPADIKHIYTNCSDSRIKTKDGFGSGHFVDPLLKLYRWMPLMLLSNEDVPNGHANGTRVILEEVVLNDGASMEQIVIDGVTCNAVEASDIKHIVCHMERKKDDDKPKKMFHIKPKRMRCGVRAPLPECFGGNAKATINFTIGITQLPLIANNATTGHKLQGQTKESLVVSCWSKRRNWNYVALSRVTTRNGLFLVSELPFDTDFSIPDDLRKMLSDLKRLEPEIVEIDLSQEKAFWESRRSPLSTP